MNPVFSPEGLRVLRTSWLLLAAALVAATTIIAGTHWYLGKEEGDARMSSRRLHDARLRVDNARREHESLEASAGKFRTLLERGLLQHENRLELVELVNELRARHQLFTVDYEIAPQRPLALAGATAYTGVELLASRVRLKARALHEGDVIAFIESLEQSRRGFYPLDRCTLRRVEAPQDNALQPRIEAECSLEWITLKERRAL